MGYLFDYIAKRTVHRVHRLLLLHRPVKVRQRFVFEHHVVADIEAGRIAGHGLVFRHHWAAVKLWPALIFDHHIWWSIWICLLVIYAKYGK